MSFEPGARVRDRFDSLSEGTKANMIARMPDGAGKPEDVGWAVAFLASPEAAYLSGMLVSIGHGVAGKPMVIQGGGTSSLTIGATLA